MGYQRINRKFRIAKLPLAGVRVIHLFHPCYPCYPSTTNGRTRASALRFDASSQRAERAVTKTGPLILVARFAEITRAFTEKFIAADRVRSARKSGIFVLVPTRESFNGGSKLELLEENASNERIFSRRQALAEMPSIFPKVRPEKYRRAFFHKRELFADSGYNVRLETKKTTTICIHTTIARPFSDFSPFSRQTVPFLSQPFNKRFSQPLMFAAILNNPGYERCPWKIRDTTCFERGS